MPAKKPKRKVMRSFKLDEISAVDKPAQEGATATIMKRKTDESLALRIVKSYLSGMKLAEPVHGRIAKSLQRKEAGQAWDNLAALETSLHSIVADSSLGDNDKLSMMKASVGEFLEFTRRETPNVEAHLEKALGAKSGSDVAKSSEEGEMNLRQLQKQMRELSGKIDSLVANQRVSKEAEAEIDDGDMMGKRVRKEGGPPAAVATGEDDAAARLRAMLSGETEKAGDYTAAPGGDAMMGDMGKGDSDDYFDEIGKAGEDEEEDYFEETEKAGDESGAEGEGFTTTEGEEEDVIAAGSSRPIGGGGGGKRADVTKRVRLYDDTIIVEGRAIHKSRVGPGLFAVLQQQQARINRVEKQAREEREARELMELAKVAEEELGHLPGTIEQKASLLKSMSVGLDDDERALISKMLRAGNGGVASAFNTVGTSAGSGNAGASSAIAKARTGFEKRISDVRARDNCSRQDAMRKARREFPDEFAAYQGN